MAMDAVVLNRKIGKCSGAEYVDDLVEVLVGFIPNEGIGLGACDLTIDYGYGIFINYDDDGNVVWKVDIVDTISDIEAG